MLLVQKTLNFLVVTSTTFGPNSAWTWEEKIKTETDIIIVKIIKDIFIVLLFAIGGVLLSLTNKLIQNFILCKFCANKYIPGNAIFTLKMNLTVELYIHLLCKIIILIINPLKSKSAICILLFLSIYTGILTSHLS